MKATLELVPEERSLTVDLPPYVMLCFCSVRWRQNTTRRGQILAITEVWREEGGRGFTCRDLEILALVASLT